MQYIAIYIYIGMTDKGHFLSSSLYVVSTNVANLFRRVG